MVLINKIKQEPITLLPLNLIKYLEEKDLNFEQLIFCNPRKGRWTLKASRMDDCSPVFMKWCDGNADRKHFYSFQRERAFYRKFGDIAFIPNVVSSEKKCLILEYVDSITLRDYLIKLKSSGSLISTSDRGDILRQLVQNIFHGRLCSSRKIDFNDTVDEIVTYWKKLLLSGPMGTARTKTEVFISKVLVFLFENRIKTKIAGLLRNAFEEQHGGQASLIHSDLHCNNILIDNFSRVYFVDFENCKMAKYWMLDIIYLWPMLMALSDQDERYQRALIEMVPATCNMKNSESLFFQKACLVLKSAVLCNTRFLNNTSVKNRMRNYVKSLLNFLRYCL